MALGGDSSDGAGGGLAPLRLYEMDREHKFAVMGALSSSVLIEIIITTRMQSNMGKTKHHSVRQPLNF